MQTIVLQQLELHFGDTFKEIYNNTRSYVKSLIARPWWVDRGALVTSEGPLSRMVEDCLAHVVEEGDKQAGWAAYTSYLASLYGSSYAHAKNISVEQAYNMTSALWSSMGAYNSASPQEFAPVGETTVVEEQVSDESPFDEEHRDFLSVYNTLGVEAAAKEYGLTPEQARTRRNTIKRTIARRLANV